MSLLHGGKLALLQGSKIIQRECPRHLGPCSSSLFGNSNRVSEATSSTSRSFSTPVRIPSNINAASSFSTILPLVSIGCGLRFHTGKHQWEQRSCRNPTPWLRGGDHKSPSPATQFSRSFHSTHLMTGELEEATGSRLRNIFRGSTNDLGELQITVGRTLYPVRDQDDLDWALNASASDVSTLEAKVGKLTEQRKRMLSIKETCDKSARRKAGSLAYGMLLLFTTEFAVMVYGTYFLFSWDIMEPISYLLGLLDVICGYGFYAYFRSNYSAGDLVSSVRGTLSNKAYKRVQFNQDELEECQKQLEMHRRRLLAVKSML